MISNSIGAYYFGTLFCSLDMHFSFGDSFYKEGGYPWEYLQYIMSRLSLVPRQKILNYLSLKGHEKEILASQYMRMSDKPELSENYKSNRYFT